MTDLAATFYGPCEPYATWQDVAASCGDSGLDLLGPPAEEGGEPTEGADVPLVIEALMWSSRRVFMATGYRFFGRCTTIFRPPCRAWCDCSSPVSCASCAGGDRLPVPFLPLREIVEIRIGGDVLDPSKYVGYSEGWIVRTDGELWPMTQGEGPATDEGSWSVEIRHGLDLPPEGKPLVALHAAELAKACKGDACSLGPGIRVVHRDGVDFAVAEPAEYRELLLTGFGPLDDWISLLNGSHVTEPPRLYRPGREAPAPILEPRP